MTYTRRTAAILLVVCVLVLAGLACRSGKPERPDAATAAQQPEAAAETPTATPMPTATPVPTQTQQPKKREGPGKRYSFEDYIK